MTPPETSETPYEQLGGRDAVLQLSERFYDIMDAHEPALAALHAQDKSGRVNQGSRDRFGLFLIGWLGGPDDYMKKHGHPRLRMRHARVKVNIEQRDAWLRCMYQALDDCKVPPAPLAYLRQRFSEVANFLRNVEEPG